MSTTKSPKRRHFSKEEKCVILSEYFDHKCSMIEVAKKYGIHPVMLAQWKRHMSDRDPKMKHVQAESIAKAQKEKEQLAKENKKQQDETRHLKKLVADLSLDKEILNEAVNVLKKSERKKKRK
jgi:transposase-like protein